MSGDFKCFNKDPKRVRYSSPLYLVQSSKYNLYIDDFYYTYNEWLVLSSAIWLVEFSLQGQLLCPKEDVLDPL